MISVPSSLPLDLPFPFALVHDIDLHGVIVSGTVSSRVPLSLGQVAFDDCALSEGVNAFHQNADENAVSKDFFRGTRIFDSVDLPNQKLVIRLSAAQIGFRRSVQECEGLVSNCWLASQAKSSPCFASASAGNAPNDVQCCVRRGGGRNEI